MPRTRTTISLSQLRVGIFVLVAIVVLIFLILNASGDINPFSKKLHLKARFVDANGLRDGSEVRLAGVRVGKVERIVLLEPSPVPNAPRVEAQLTIDSVIDGRPANERIRSDSQAQQGSPSLLGNEMLINITPGTAVGQPIQDGAVLPSSSSNTVNDFATSGTDLAQRLSKLSDQMSEIVLQVKQGQGTVGRLIRDEQSYNDARAAIARFNTTAERIDNVVAAAQRGEGTVGKLLNDETLYTNVNQLSSEGVKMIYDFRQNPKKYLTIKFE